MQSTVNLQYRRSVASNGDGDALWWHPTRIVTVTARKQTRLAECMSCVASVFCLWAVEWTFTLIVHLSNRSVVSGMPNKFKFIGGASVKEFSIDFLCFHRLFYRCAYVSNWKLESR